jgi:hypothetical protein
MWFEPTSKVFRRSVGSGEAGPSSIGRQADRATCHVTRKHIARRRGGDGQNSQTRYALLTMYSHKHPAQQRQSIVTNTAQLSDRRARS